MSDKRSSVVIPTAEGEIRGVVQEDGVTFISEQELEPTATGEKPELIRPTASLRLHQDRNKNVTLGWIVDGAEEQEKNDSPLTLRAPLNRAQRRALGFRGPLPRVPASKEQKIR